MEDIKNINLNSDLMDKKIVSIISHELRGSFNSILGISNLILKDDLVEKSELKELIISIRNSANRSYTVLDNLFHISAIKNRDYDGYYEKISIEKLVRETLQFFKFPFDQKQILLVLNLRKNLDVVFVKSVLKFILKNLIENAVKFSNVGGRIEINSRIEKDYFELEVEDNGIGMSKLKVDQIFMDKDISGIGSNNSGFGLKLCKHYIEKLNGDLVVKSKFGLGSKFTLKFPLNLSKNIT